jgi:hypothetical protein
MKLPSPADCNCREGEPATFKMTTAFGTTSPSLSTIVPEMLLGLGAAEGAGMAVVSVDGDAVMDAGADELSWE